MTYLCEIHSKTGHYLFAADFNKPPSKRDVVVKAVEYLIISLDDVKQRMFIKAKLKHENL